MKILCLILAALLLVGCGAEAPAATTEPTTVPATTEAETEPPTTEPPDPVLKILDNMSREEKVGQLFLSRYPGETALADPDLAAACCDAIV